MKVHEHQKAYTHVIGPFLDDRLIHFREEIPAEPPLVYTHALQAGKFIKARPDLRYWIEVERDANGQEKLTGVRKCGPHSMKTHATVPEALVDHAHIPGVCNQSGTAHLPLQTSRN